MIVTVLKMIFLLGFLILIHEAGHYTVAKLCKIKVNQFSIGFGKKIFSKNKNGTEYELRLIPLGGFVSLEGEEENSDKEGSFRKASIPKRIAVILAGAVVNIIFGILAYLILILVRYMIVNSANLGDAFIYSIKAVQELIQVMYQGIIELFSGNMSLNDMTGPVGISVMVSQTSGFTEFIYLLSIISISLGMTNLLPLIPLDGGKAILLIIEGIRKKPLKEETEAKIQMIGMAFIIFISLAVTFNDVGNLFK